MSTILIVDDDESFREMLRAGLEAHGFHVLAAGNTGEGLEVAAVHEVDAVVSDYQMPKTDGLSFCRALCEQSARLGRQVPVWLMTGTVGFPEKEATMAGAEGVFRKPFHVREIAKSIEERLQREVSTTSAAQTAHH